ncbi:hypothetical protein TNCV_1038601 [Trichonephila clavipes]|uniref:Uncharacterized protein n=1 Tax=Trichonephila clavipes TaxID=2585209 RepID=A0A8X6VW90_TRICX|nr:hypothetical protein TNCV_1038601 [Trichonephila clavipes]
MSSPVQIKETYCAYAKMRRSDHSFTHPKSESFPDGFNECKISPTRGLYGNQPNFFNSTVTNNRVATVSDRGWLVTSSSPVPLKTRRVEMRCTLNLSRLRRPLVGVVVRICMLPECHLQSEHALVDRASCWFDRIAHPDGLPEWPAVLLEDLRLVHM